MCCFNKVNLSAILLVHKCIIEMGVCRMDWISLIDWDMGLMGAPCSTGLNTTAVHCVRLRFSRQRMSAVCEQRLVSLELLASCRFVSVNQQTVCCCCTCSLTVREVALQGGVEVLGVERPWMVPPNSDDRMAASWFRPLSCCCANHFQFSQALCAPPSRVGHIHALWNETLYLSNVMHFVL